MDWFESKLGEIVNITVGSYEVRNGPNAGKSRNTIRSIAAIPSMFKSQVGESRSEQFYFDPYEDSSKMFAAYSGLYKFQRHMLVEAADSQHIIFAGKEPQAPSEREHAPAPKVAALVPL